MKLKIKEDNYELKLTAQNIVDLEDEFDNNLILIFGDDGRRIPRTKEMIKILQYASGKTYGEACVLFEEWLADGHIVTDFVGVIMEIYKDSGVVKNSPKSKNVK